MSICEKQPINGSCEYIEYFHNCKQFRDYIREYLKFNKCNNGIIEIGDCIKKGKSLSTKNKSKTNNKISRKALSLNDKNKLENLNELPFLKEIVKVNRKDELKKIILSLYELKKFQMKINNKSINSIKSEQKNKIIEQVSLRTLTKEELKELLHKLVEDVVIENRIFATREKLKRTPTKSIKHKSKS